eukprot:12886585-Prorocentrum_lima.AAC.1
MEDDMRSKERLQAEAIDRVMREQEDTKRRWQGDAVSAIEQARSKAMTEAEEKKEEEIRQLKL